MSSTTILPCTVSDGPAIGHLNVAAFWTDATWRRMWLGKTPEFMASQAALRAPAALLADRVRRRHLKAIDAITSEVVGYARWVLPETPIAAELWPAAQVPVVSEEQVVEAERDSESADWTPDPALDVLDLAYMEMRDRLMQGKTYVLLDYLTVHPDRRGRGIASLLVDQGQNEIDKMNLDTFVLARPAALGVYRRSGFRLLDEVHQDGSSVGAEKDFAIYFLERLAAASSQPEV